MGFLFLIFALPEPDQQGVRFLIQQAGKGEELCGLHCFQSTHGDQFSWQRQSLYINPY